MSTNQKRLKLLSLALMALGIVGIVGGVLVLTGSPAAAVVRPSVGTAAAWAAPAEVVGVVALVVGVFSLAVGVFGARAANNPRRVGAFRTLDVVLVVAALAELALGAGAGQLAWIELLLALVGAAAFAFAGRANREALDR